MLRVLKRTRTLRLSEPNAVFRATNKSNNNISLVKPIVTGLCLTTVTFTVAGLVHERETERFWKKLYKRVDGPEWSHLRSIITDDRLLWRDVWNEQAKIWKEKQQKLLAQLKYRLEQYQVLPEPIKQLVLKATRTWFSLPESEKTMACLIGLNSLVFLAWRIPVLQPSMTRWFLHKSGIGGGHSIVTLVTSCFSHRDLLHLTVNMVGLWSFGPLIFDVLGKEQFLAAYISFGINSNVVGQVVSIAMRKTRPIQPWLGASGAVYGLLSGTALLYPNSSVFIPFLPMLPIPINYAVPALVTTDVAGILLRWRKFNHITHLGGAALGLGYMKYGPEYIWQPLLKKIRELKGKGSNNRGDGSGIMMEIPNKKLVSWLKKTTTVPEKQ